MFGRLSRHCTRKGTGVGELLCKIPKRNGVFWLAEDYILSNDPFVELYYEPSQTEIFLLGCSHWVDIDDFESIEQTKFGKTDKFASLHEWISEIGPDSIFLDIDETRLQGMDQWLSKHPRPSLENTNANSYSDDDYDIDELEMENEMESYFGMNEENENDNEENNLNHEEKNRKIKKISQNSVKKQEKSLSEKLRNIDHIRYKRDLPIKLQDGRVKEIPRMTEYDLWQLDLYWNLIDKHFSRMIPQFDSFKREFYLHPPKWRFLSLCFGSEIETSLNYCRYNKTIDNKSIDMICGGMPIETIVQLLRDSERPLNWLHFGVALKNYFENSQNKNIARQNATVFDLFESGLTPQAQSVMRFGWDSTVEITDMIQDVVPAFYNILYKKQRQFVFNSFMQSLENQKNKHNRTNRMVAILGQGNMVRLFDLMEPNVISKFRLFDENEARILTSESAPPSVD